MIKSERKIWIADNHSPESFSFERNDFARGQAELRFDRYLDSVRPFLATLDQKLPLPILAGTNPRGERRRGTSLRERVGVRVHARAQQSIMRLMLLPLEIQTQRILR